MSSKRFVVGEYCKLGSWFESSRVFVNLKCLVCWRYLQM